MPYEIRTNAYYEDVIEWLQENVGDLLWSRPILEWRGRGWTINRLGSATDYKWLIRIDDSRLAMITTLRWS